MIHVKLVTRLLCVALACLALSCSATKPSNEVSPASSPSTTSDPAKPQTPGAQSANWSVTIVSAEKIPKPKPTPDNTGIPGDRAVRNTSLYDTLKVDFQVEYLGATGDVIAPSAALVDDKGRRFEVLSVGLTAPPGTEIKSPDDPAMKALDEILDWFDSANPDKVKKSTKTKSRKLNAGDRFLINDVFEDPKSSTIKLIFSDVPPILLPAAKEREPLK